jgi:PilZ domain-containing protein
MSDSKEMSDSSRGTLPRVYFRLLDEARTISERALERLHTLSNQFPAALPDELLEQVERIRSDPAHERRRSPRLHESTFPANVTEPADLTGWTGALVIDRSPGGLALLLHNPVEAGMVLLVWFGSAGDEDAWLPVEVKHCRPEAENWIVGVEFTGRAKPSSVGSNQTRQPNHQG